MRAPIMSNREILSALTLTPDEKQKAVAKFLKIFGGVAAPTFRIAPEILGGLVFKNEDKILDASVAEELSQLKKHLLS